MGANRLGAAVAVTKRRGYGGKSQPERLLDVAVRAKGGIVARSAFYRRKAEWGRAGGDRQFWAAMSFFNSLKKLII